MLNELYLLAFRIHIKRPVNHFMGLQAAYLNQSRYMVYKSKVMLLPLARDTQIMMVF